MTSRPPPSLIIDSGVRVLLLTTVAYEAAYIYEVSYLGHFGVPVAFVDVSLHELLLCGIACVIASFAIIWIEVVWGTIPSKTPPRLAKALMTLLMLIIAVLVLCALIDAPFMLGMSVIGGLFLAAVALLLLPLLLHRRLPKLASRYWAVYGADQSDRVKAPSILWFSVSRGVIIAIAVVVITGLFSSAFGLWHARVQRDFAISNVTDNCAVLRLSSDGYLCVGIDFHKHIALGTFRYLDPKGLELHLLRVGRLAPFIAPPPP